MRAYRLLLLAYPRGFRRRYGDEMAQVFEGLRDRAWSRRGALGVTLLWIRTVWDMTTSGLGHRLRVRRMDGDEEGRMGKIAFHIGQAARRLRRTPGYVAAFVLTLGLAIGVNSSVFSVVNGVLLQPLPFPDADRILFVKHVAPGRGDMRLRFSFMEIDDYRAAATTIEEFVEFREWEFTTLLDGQPHRVLAGMVTSNYFEMLDMRPRLGRILNAEDDQMGSEAVMVITDEYWDRTFGRDPSVIGRLVDLEHLTAENPYTPTRIVGVLEPRLNYMSSRQPDFYNNYSASQHYQSASMRDLRTHRMTEIFAVMRPGVTPAAARAELEGITREVQQRYPEIYRTELRYGIEVMPWKEQLTREGRTTFLFLMGTVGLVLLLAAANVTNLVLTRLIRKEGEMATRAALGASTTDIRLQLTAEHLLLGALGGALGVLLAYASRDGLVAYASRFTVRAQEVGVDWTVLGTTLLSATGLAVVLAWLPGLPVGVGLSRVATAQSRTTDSRWRKGLQRGLVVSQLALSFTLLTGTGLLVKSLLALTSISTGFRTEQIYSMRAPTGPRGLPMGNSIDPGWENALDEIQAYPGVRAAAIASWAPLSHPTSVAYGVRTDEDDPSIDRSHVAASNNVSPGYFEMLDIPLVAGRSFEDTDRRGSPYVVILNQSMARAYFGGDDPIGRRIWIGSDPYRVFVREWYEVVGVVADTQEQGIGEEGAHTFYRPAAQTKWGPAIVMAYAGDPTGLSEHVRDVVYRMQPERALEPVQPLTALLDLDVAPSRLNAVLFGSFAMLALLIAALGVLATLAFSVGQRVREFGIRLAVGADQASVLRNVLGEGVLLVAVALVFGTGASLVMGRFLSGLLYEIGPVDLLSMGVAASVLAVVALGAALFPALRATRIHPTEALRGE